MSFGTTYPPGHEHAGKARSRKAVCGAMYDGAVCGLEFVRFRQDPSFGAANPIAQEAYLRTACVKDEAGHHWFPKNCPRCERRRMENES